MKFTTALSADSCILFLSEVSEGELNGASSSVTSDDVPPSISLDKKKFGGKYAISADEFTSELVSASNFRKFDCLLSPFRVLY